ncbi:sterol desaturase family protein [Gemmata sp.]|uniref:sterol desaturase family protein n=1 Tax=Gemmata sp. TaxID=1914242 RepID=UPI003F6F5276
MAADLSSGTQALSLASMPIAFGLALGYVLLKPRRRGRTGLRTALRVLLPKGIWLHPSTLLDVQYILVGSLAFSVVFGYTLLSGYAVTSGVSEALAGVFGPREAPAGVPVVALGALVLVQYLAFEFTYWLYHLLSHKVPFLWEFHKVHHSATVLTPFANWRVHPVDTILYVNALSLFGGATGGAIYYWFGEDAWLTSAVGSGVLYALYLSLWGHLQHSQLWIAFTGLPGRLVLSPAHHQIHHSDNPVHFDKNFGAGFAIWDWLFGTLHVPQREREALHFGTRNDRHLKKLVPSLVYPFRHAARHLLGVFRRPKRKVSRPPGAAPTDLKVEPARVGQAADREHASGAA